MAVTLKQVEALPDDFPDGPGGLSAAALALDGDAIWQRIEAYVAHRWSPRSVVWTVEGEGDWEPPLAPAVVQSVEVWEAGAWVASVSIPSPYGGLCLLGDGPYRITATVGGDDVPAAAQEAFRRLAEYMAEGESNPGASSYKIDLGQLSESVERAPTWLARALQLSGAADLLRPYRKA